MKCELTNTQYVSFLNAIDPDGLNPNDVYHSSMGSDARGGILDSGGAFGSHYVTRPNMGDKAVNFISWFRAARVANWLHNGAKSYGNTDSSATAPQNTGAYSTGTSTGGSTVPKNEGAIFWIPTENEWYKAAYYNPTLNNGAGGYRVYGNGFDTTSSVSANGIGDGSAGSIGSLANYNSGADWNGQDGNVTTVGTNGGASYYGAFDMSGNAWEFVDAGYLLALRGGGWRSSALDVSSFGGWPQRPISSTNDWGFRIATVPEPSTYAMALAGLACGGYLVRRRRKQA